MGKTRYLVIGAAVSEAVTHEETQRQRRDVGGVAGQMATALGRHGCQVTILTSTAQGPEAQRTVQMLEEAGVIVHAIEGRHHTGWCRITTRGGEQRSAHGQWPRPDEGINHYVPELVQQADWLLLDCNMSSRTAQLTLLNAAQARVPVTINATTRSRSSLIWETRQTPKRLVTMNRAEAHNLMGLAKCHAYPELRERINTRNILVTLGPDGWKLYGANGAHRSSKAITPPKDTDFIGCGDYATAGLSHAIAQNLPINQTVNDFISKRAQLNRL